MKKCCEVAVRSALDKSRADRVAIEHERELAAHRQKIIDEGRKEGKKLFGSKWANPYIFTDYDDAKLWYRGFERGKRNSFWTYTG